MKIVSFIDKGVKITDPYSSPCGLFSARPDDYGFFVQHTGGGCMALQKNLDGGRFILITDDSGSAIPYDDDEPAPENIWIGLYSEDASEPIAFNTLAEARQG